MSNALYDAAMSNYIEDYLDEHPDADWMEAYDAWHRDEYQAYAKFDPERVDDARQKMKDART